MILHVSKNTYLYIFTHKTTDAQPLTSGEPKCDMLTEWIPALCERRCLRKLKKGATVKKEKKNLISLKLVPVVLQSVTPQEEGEKEGAVCQLTVVQMYKQLFKLVLSQQVKLMNRLNTLCKIIIIKINIKDI